MEVLVSDFPDRDQLSENSLYVIIREQVRRNPEIGVNGLRKNLRHPRVLADIGADEQVYARALKSPSLGRWFRVLQPPHRFERVPPGRLVSGKKLSEQNEVLVAGMSQRIRIGIRRCHSSPQFISACDHSP